MIFRAFRLAEFTKKSRLTCVADATFSVTSPLSLCRVVVRRIDRSARAIAAVGGRAKREDW
ncbi:hypothetical protein A8B73_06060 [Methylosinus sp. 3S-1]|nr:hypothetical protein A8B73_06060 [Methylosinus sp. 3S-1]